MGFAILHMAKITKNLATSPACAQGTRTPASCSETAAVAWLTSEGRVNAVFLLDANLLLDV